MKKKNQIWIVATIVIIALITITSVYYWKTTTYEKVLGKVLPNDESVQQITIRYCNLKKNAEQDKTMTLSNQEDIDKVIEQPSNMKLNRTSQDNDALYLIEFRIDEDRQPYMITVDDHDILKTSGERGAAMRKHDYNIKGQNQLVETIEANEDKWESIDKDTGTLDSGRLYKFCPNS